MNTFDSLDQDTKVKIIRLHPDLGDKLKIREGLTNFSQEEQSRAGLAECNDQEFKEFNRLNNEFKSKFNIPFIYAVRGKTKQDILDEFIGRLKSDNMEQELDKSLIQVKKIANLRINEIIRKSKTSKLKIGYKFGLEFLNSKNGRKFVSKLKNQITFGDYKFSDIPNTCSSAIKAIKDLKFNYCTVHISSGLEALKAAKKASGRTKLVGVTILTSLDNKALKEIGFNKDVKKLVYQQAKLANKAKLDAIVCSAQEVKIVRKVFKKEIITPGIRFNSKSSKLNDQKRILTPNQAYKNGSDWLVIGRPITRGNIKNNIQRLIDHLNQ